MDVYTLSGERPAEIMKKYANQKGMNLRATTNKVKMNPKKKTMLNTFPHV